MWGILSVVNIAVMNYVTVVGFGKLCPNPSYSLRLGVSRRAVVPL